MEPVAHFAMGVRRIGPAWLVTSGLAEEFPILLALALEFINWLFVEDSLIFF